VADRKQSRVEKESGSPSLVLPCVDSSVQSNYFNELLHAEEVRLLPVALASTLNFRIQRDRPDVVVIASADFTGWKNSVSREELLIHVPTILLTAEVDAKVKKKASRLHIDSVLPLDVNMHQLLAAITATAAGLTVGFVQTEDTFPGWSESADEASSRTEHLTAREREVLNLMAAGFGNKKIAARLHISEHTAKFHVSSVLGKLGATSRTEAVTLGITHGLVAI
jgi:two-component system, NarL family, response regulator YdfI